MRFLRQNTAVMVTVGPFYDVAGLIIETALTITNERITLTADTDNGSAPTNILDNITGATTGTANDLNYITGNDAGMMQLELAAADTNRVGRMMLSITDAANHVPVFHEFFVLPQAIYDWFTGVIVPLPANTTHAAGTAWGSGAITAASIAADAITAAKVADDVSTEFRTKAMALTTASGVVGSGSTTANVVASSVAVGATTSLSADAFKGRIIIFNSDTTTAALRGQAAAIVSHTSGATPTFTLATGAWTTAPLTTDSFTVV